MDQLQQARAQIDEIDAKMAALFEQRMQAVGQVAQYKARTGKQVFDPAREALVLEKNTARVQNPELQPYYREFLKKAGAVLFPASVVIWALGYFDFSMYHVADAKFSMLGRIGGAISFIFSPLGLSDWRCCVALISGLVARETTVSTLGILIGSAQSVRDIISPQAACAFMSFSLLSMPCVAAVAALRRELGTKSTLKVLIFEFITAWIVSFAVYRIALLI